MVPAPPIPSDAHASSGDSLSRTDNYKLRQKAIRFTLLFTLLILVFSSPVMVRSCSLDIAVGFPVVMAQIHESPSAISFQGFLPLAINLVVDTLLAIIFFRMVRDLIRKKMAGHVCIGGLRLALLYGLYASLVAMFINNSVIDNGEPFFLLVGTAIWFHYPTMYLVDLGLVHEPFWEVYLPRVLLFPTLVLFWLFFTALNWMCRMFLKTLRRMITAT